MIVKKSKIRKAWDIILYSTKISFKGSILCTIVRLMSIIISSILPVVNLSITRRIVNELTYNLDKRIFVSLILINLLISLFGVIINGINSYTSTVHNEKIARIISLEKFQKSIKINMEYYDSAEYYNEYINASNNSGVIPGVIWNIINMIGNISKMIAMGYIFLNYSISWTVLLIISAIPCAVVEIYQKKQLLKMQKENIPYDRKLGYISGLFSNKEAVQDTKLNQCFEHLIGRFNEQWNIRYNRMITITRKNLVRTNLISIFPQIVLALFSIVFGFNVIKSIYSIGDYTYYSGCAGQFLSGVITFIGLSAILSDSVQRSSIYVDFLEKGKEMSDGYITLEKDCEHHFVFKNLEFKYPGTEKIIFRNLDKK